MKNPFQFRFPYAEFPAVRVALIFIAGVITAIKGWFPAQNGLLIMAALMVVCLILEAQATRRLDPWLNSLCILFYSLMIFIFGGVHYTKSIYHSELQKPDWVLELKSVEIRVQGVISQSWVSDTGKRRADLEISWIYGGKEWNEVTGFTARLLADKEFLTEGDTLDALVQVVPIGGKRNPEDFDYKAYLESRNIYIQFRLNEIYGIYQLSDRISWAWWRHRCLRATEQIFTEETLPIARALLLGYKNDLKQDQKQAYSRAGLSHIMAVSGLHVGFMIAPFWLLVPYLRRSRSGRVAGIMLVAGILWIYAGITGFSASVMRASVTALFLLYGSLYNRAGDSLNLTAAAALVLLVIDPSQLLDIGFQLSFGAVYTILLVMPVVQRNLPYVLRVRWYGKPVMAGLISIVVQFGLYPLQAHYFGEMSLISPLANMLFIPFLGIIIPVSVLSVIIWMMSPGLAHLLAFGSIYFLSWMNQLVLLIPDQQWAWTRINSPSIWIFPLWIALIAGIKAARIPKVRWKWLLFGLSCILAIQVSGSIKWFSDRDLQVLYFDVGQGDAALIRTPNHKYILIDTGVWSPGYNSGASVILPHLDKMGISQLDAVILSHPHADHIGGTVDILEAIRVKKVYNAGFDYESALYRRYLGKAEEKGVPVQSVHNGDSLLIDPAILIMIMGPDGKVHSDDPNEHSVVVRLQYGDTGFLFTGDAGKHQENRLITRYGDLLDTDVLKVGHHGSRTSSHSPFLQVVTPEIAVISLAERNKFRHPHKEALERLQETGARLLFTSKERAIWLESDGNVIQQKQWY